MDQISDWFWPKNTRNYSENIRVNYMQQLDTIEKNNSTNASNNSNNEILSTQSYCNERTATYSNDLFKLTQLELDALWGCIHPSNSCSKSSTDGYKASPCLSLCFFSIFGPIKRRRFGAIFSKKFQIGLPAWFLGHTGSEHCCLNGSTPARRNVVG